MKIGFLQFDERIDDENIKAAIEINKKYCDLHGYNYIFKALKEEDMHHDLDGYIMNEDNAFKLNAYDYRIKMIEQYMNDYDILIYLDTDAIIYNPTIRIENIIDFEHTLFLFPDSCRVGNTYDILISANRVVKKLNEMKLPFFKNPLKDLNSLLIDEYDKTLNVLSYLAKIAANPEGFMSGCLIVNTANKKILKEFIEDFKRFYPISENIVFDQGTIGILLKRKKYNNFWKMLPAHMHGNPFFNNINVPGIDDYKLTDKTFICHFYAHSKYKEECRKYIEEVKNNKWWTTIK